MADVDSSFKNWSTTAGSNAPSGSTSIGAGMDDNLREIQAVIRAALGSKGADIASATTTDLGAIAGLYHDITGTTTITGFGTVAAGIWKLLQFDGALTLTHNASSLKLPGGANITTAAGDHCLAFSLGSGNWFVPFYEKASGAPLVSITAAMLASKAVSLAKMADGTQGGTLYYGASGVIAELAAGTAGKFLQTLGASANPAWSDTPLENPIVDPSCDIGQGSTATVSGTAQYAQVDMVAVWASAGTPSAGTIKKDILAGGESALKLEGATATGSAVWSARTRIEAKDAIKWKNRTASIQCRVAHNVGSAINYTIVVRKPTASDNWAATTTIGTSGTTSVSDQTETIVKYENLSLGDCSNGLEIEVQAASGAVTTKYFFWTNWQIDEGSVCLSFRPICFSDAMARAQRYYEKSYAYSTVPGTATTTGAEYTIPPNASDAGQGRSVRFMVAKRVAPTVTVYSTATGASGNVSNSGDKAASGGAITEFSYTLTGSAFSSGNGCLWHWTADARL